MSEECLEFSAHLLRGEVCGSREWVQNTCLGEWEWRGVVEGTYNTSLQTVSINGQAYYFFWNNNGVATPWGNDGSKVGSRELGNTASLGEGVSC